MARDELIPNMLRIGGVMPSIFYIVFLAFIFLRFYKNPMFFPQWVGGTFFYGLIGIMPLGGEYYFIFQYFSFIDIYLFIGCLVVTIFMQVLKGSDGLFFLMVLPSLIWSYKLINIFQKENITTIFVIFLVNFILFGCYVLLGEKSQKQDKDN